MEKSAKIVVVGASTGGTEALSSFLESLPNVRKNSLSRGGIK